MKHEKPKGNFQDTKPPETHLQSIRLLFNLVQHGYCCLIFCGRIFGQVEVVSVISIAKGLASFHSSLSFIISYSIPFRKCS